MTTRTLFFFLHSKACITMAFNNHEFLSQALGSSISPNAMAFGSIRGIQQNDFSFPAHEAMTSEVREKHGMRQITHAYSPATKSDSHRNRLS